jgi:pyruvate/2-oxoglutarate dehydrogenase complex dihydrolipoamide acyltransferase (E2) component
MKTEIKVPELGDDVTEATVSFWYFDEGEKVDEGADLVELLTDKAAFNVAAPAGGTLVKIDAGEGDKVAVGDAIGAIETEA